MPPAIRIPSDEGNPLLSVQRGARADVLVVAFTGFRNWLVASNFDFDDVTAQLGCSRILLRDPSQRCFLGGIDTLAPGIQGLLDRLRAEQARLAPARTMVIGNSGGAFSALLFGHLLGADWVHAFAPYTNLHPDYLDRFDKLPGGAENLAAKLRRLGPSVLSHCDLREALQEWNGRTVYNLHVCNGSAAGLDQTRHLEDRPGVRVFGYPCDSHFVSWELARVRMLRDILDLDHQDSLPEFLAGN